MRPNARPREVDSGGVTASGEFGISTKDTAHIMGILRDTLYSDKILAVLREYSSNAWDANRAAGKEDMPILIILPTEMDPTLHIRDYGPGLSSEDVFTVYTQYGASTKRNDNNSVGMLGIGSKSGFAYSDSFTITSWHDGWKRTYVAVLDASDKGVMNLLHEEACDYEETGVEIQIAVRQEDIGEFEEKAKDLFRHFTPRPEINTELPKVTEEQTYTSTGVLWRERWNNNVWTAVMGCVPYEVDINEIVDREVEGEQAGEYLKRLSGILYFDIGEVEISASRERLKYSTKTRLHLIRKFNHVVDEYVRSILEEIRKSGITPWERRIRAQTLNELKLPVPKELSEEVKDVVEIGHPVTFVLVQPDDKTHTQHTQHISVTNETRFLRRDDQRAIVGYKLKSYDYMVRLVGTATWDEANAELEGLLEKAALTGVSISDMSTLHWEMPRKAGWKAPKTKNVKHKVRTFRLDPSKSFYSPYSAFWEIDVREPLDEDVFIVMKNFKAEGYEFYAKYKEDKALVEAFETASLPTIYGYKSTEKKPVKVEDCKGTEYRAWRRAFVKSIAADPKIQRDLERWEWSRALDNTYHRRGRNIGDIVTLLGRTHHITKFVGKQFSAHKVMGKADYHRKEALAFLHRRIHPSTELTSQGLALQEIYTRYPLLKVAGDGLDVLWEEHAKTWAEYIAMIDRTIPVAETQEPEIQEEELAS